MFHCLLTTHLSLMFVFFSTVFHCTLVSCGRNCCVHAVRLSLIALVWSLFLQNCSCWYNVVFGCWHLTVFLFLFSFQLCGKCSENASQELQTVSTLLTQYVLYSMFDFCLNGYTVVVLCSQFLGKNEIWLTCRILVIQSHSLQWTTHTKPYGPAYDTLGWDVTATYGYLMLSNHIVALNKQDPMLRHFCPCQYSRIQ